MELSPDFIESHEDIKRTIGIFDLMIHNKATQVELRKFAKTNLESFKLTFERMFEMLLLTNDYFKYSRIYLYCSISNDTFIYKGTELFDYMGYHPYVFDMEYNFITQIGFIFQPDISKTAPEMVAFIIADLIAYNAITGSKKNLEDTLRALSIDDNIKAMVNKELATFAFDSLY